jgi:hypothetical protein
MGTTGLHDGPAGRQLLPAMVAHLPEPARRFFRFAIQPGARLASAVEISMEGELSRGTKDNPKPVHFPTGGRHFLWHGEVLRSDEAWLATG